MKLGKNTSLGDLLEHGRVLGDKRDSIFALPVSSLAFDSRAVEHGSVFFAIPGTRLDGRAFIAEAVQNGASVICAEDGEIEQQLAEAQVPVVLVADVRAALAYAAKEFYASPSKELFSIAITGTNGKTSVSWIMAEAFSALGIPMAQVGTLGMRTLGVNEALSVETTVTTPDPLTLQSFLASARERGVQGLSMEVSSHGIAQKRAAEIQWDRAVFTNLTRDHLDYHPTVEAYAATKTKLFTEGLAESKKEGKAAIVNIDDPLGRELAARLQRDFPALRLITVSASGQSNASVVLRKTSGTFQSTKIEASLEGRVISIETKLIGSYNVLNMLLSLAVLASADVSQEKLKEALWHVPVVPGRLERVAETRLPVYIDYAHTPDALIRAQTALKELGAARLITVFGCGGDRDRGKRPLMGEAVTSVADVAVVTSDNPRSEDPQAIIDQIVSGLREDFSYQVILDRRRAIEWAIGEAKPGDVVLVAGKGHEAYQEIAGEKIPFSDYKVCLDILQHLSGQ